MRLALYIVTALLLFIPDAYAQKYVELNSKLEPQFRHRAHNQYLAIFVTFGLIGIIWFLFSLIYPGIKKRKLNKYHYFVFWMTMMLSMLAEDTLETQMGVTLFAFFSVSHLPSFFRGQMQI